MAKGSRDFGIQCSNLAGLVGRETGVNMKRAGLRVAFGRSFQVSAREWKWVIWTGLLIAASGLRAEIPPGLNHHDNWDPTGAFSAFDSWANRYVAGDHGTPRATQLQEGLALAKKRRTAFKKLIESAPDRALAASMSRRMRRQLPPEIAGEMEEPVSG